MSVSFDIITEKKHYIWLMRNKVKKYFKINYCRKGKGVSTLIDDNNRYIINILNKGFHIIITDNKEEYMNKTIDEFINFFNCNFKNTTIGFRQNTGEKIPLDKFKNIKIIELYSEYNEKYNDDIVICPDCGAYIDRY